MVVARPIWGSEGRITSGLKNVVGWFSSKNSLIDENKRLKEQITSYQITELSLRANEEQYSRLLVILGRKPVNQSVTATVLVHPPRAPYDILIIDAGEREGLKMGDTVIMPEGPILGTIEEVFYNTSRVKLYSKNGEKVDAVLERGNIPVVLLGQGGGSFKLVLPRDVEVEPEDRIISPGIDSKLLGIVEEITVKPTDSSKDVLVRSPANIFAIRFVLVMQ